MSEEKTQSPDETRQQMVESHVELFGKEENVELKQDFFDLLFSNIRDLKPLSQDLLSICWRVDPDVVGDELSVCLAEGVKSPPYSLFWQWFENNLKHAEIFDDEKMQSEHPNLISLFDTAKGQTQTVVLRSRRHLYSIPPGQMDHIIDRVHGMFQVVDQFDELAKITTSWSDQLKGQFVEDIVRMMDQSDESMKLRMGLATTPFTAVSVDLIVHILTFLTVGKRANVAEVCNVFNSASRQFDYACPVWVSLSVGYRPVQKWSLKWSKKEQMRVISYAGAMRGPHVRDNLEDSIPLLDHLTDMGGKMFIDAAQFKAENFRKDTFILQQVMPRVRRWLIKYSYQCVDIEKSHAFAHTFDTRSQYVQIAEALDIMQFCTGCERFDMDWSLSSRYYRYDDYDTDDRPRGRMACFLLTGLDRLPPNLKTIVIDSRTQEKMFCDWSGFATLVRRFSDAECTRWLKGIEKLVFRDLWSRRIGHMFTPNPDAMTQIFRVLNCADNIREIDTDVPAFGRSRRSLLQLCGPLTESISFTTENCFQSYSATAEETFLGYFDCEMLLERSPRMKHLRIKMEPGQVGNNQVSFWVMNKCLQILELESIEFLICISDFHAPHFRQPDWDNINGGGTLGSLASRWTEIGWPQNQFGTHARFRFTFYDGKKRKPNPNFQERYDYWVWFFKQKLQGFEYHFGMEPEAVGF